MNPSASSRLPAYLPFMAALTGLYLTVEVPFSAHLIDVLGGNPTADDINDIERFGRILTGAAVAIAFIGWILAREHARSTWIERRRVIPRGLPKALVVGLACLGLTYVALDRIATGIGDGSSGVDRKKALTAVLTRQAMAGADATFIDLIPEGDPSWKAFLSVSPILDGNGKLMALAKVDRQAMLADEASRRVGSPADFRERVFGTGFASVREAFSRYEEGSGRFRSAASEVDKKVARDWGNYLGKREGAGLAVIRSNSEADSIRRRVISSGVPVPENWHPNDRRGFEAALRGKMMREIERTYVSAIEDRLGKGSFIRPGLSFEPFVADPAVQRMIRKTLGIAPGAVVIRPGMTDAQFLEGVYQPSLAAARKDIAEALAAPATEFVNGARFDTIGRAAAQSASIPALAIVLSLAGAFFHICKITGFLTQICGYLTPVRMLRSGFAKWSVGTLVATGTAMAMLTPTNAVTTSAHYSAIIDSGPIARILGASIAIQPSFQPMGQVLGSIGGWRLISGSLPAARTASAT